MNYILTYDCNKGCPYCFAATVRNEKKEKKHMTIGSFRKLLDKSNSRVKLLGGEPTQHPEFDKILDELILRRRQFTLISNFLFNEDILKLILNAIQYCDVSFLINATDLDKKDRISIWALNYLAIYKALYKVDNENKVTIGLTLEAKKDYKYYLDYIDFLLKYIEKFETLRLSLDFSVKNSDGDFDFINNKEYGKKLLYITKKAIDNGANVSIDCNVYPCIFLNKEEYKYINKFSTHPVEFVCSGRIPADIFPDETMSYCYPLKKLNVDTNNYDKLEDSMNALKVKYDIIKSQQILPSVCNECSFHKSKICAGPSLCSYGNKI